MVEKTKELKEKDKSYCLHGGVTVHALFLTVHVPFTHFLAIFFN